MACSVLTKRRKEEDPAMTMMTECAILAIADRTEIVRALLQRLVKGVAGDDDSVVPWTIANKYYTARVQFLVQSLSSWALARQQLLTPAVLFVWNSGEHYRDHIRTLSQHTSQHEFEVALAVRLPPIDSISPTEVEDDQDIDAYLSSKGFEFVDVPDIQPPFQDRSSVLGMPRIIDALSTIMWPSMVRRTLTGVTTSGLAMHYGPGISSGDYHTLVRLVGEKISGNDSNHMQRELEELERWLDQDVPSSDADAQSAGNDDEAVIWSSVPTPGTPSPSSSSLSLLTTPKLGFDDDFTSFVSASPPNLTAVPLSALGSTSSSQTFPFTSFSSTFSFDSISSGRSTPTLGDFDVTRLAPDESYKSLRSVSDFGDLDKDAVNLDRLTDNNEDVDQDLPSRAEIAETSRRIFGSIPLSLSPAQERGDMNFHALGGRGHSTQELDVEMTGTDLERFDLQGILGALQGLKEEIAGMPDKERRKAAARVALGLAYGLDSNLHSEASGEELV